MTNRRYSIELKFSPGADSTICRVIYSGLLERTIKKRKRRKEKNERRVRPFHVWEGPNLVCDRPRAVIEDEIYERSAIAKTLIYINEY